MTINTLEHVQIDLPITIIAAFCERWHVIELALFGSVLRPDFRPESDIDLLITFAPGTAFNLRELTAMQTEVEALFNRPVDLIDRPSLIQSPNYLRRNAILNSAKVIYAI